MAQQANNAVKEEKLGRATVARQKIAEVEDARALEQVRNQSLRPDNDLQSRISSIQASPVPETLAGAYIEDGSEGEFLLLVAILPSNFFEDIELPDDVPYATTPRGTSDYNSSMDYNAKSEHMSIDNGREIEEGSAYNDSEQEFAFEESEPESEFDYNAAMEELKKTRREAKAQTSKATKKKLAAEYKKVQKTAIHDSQKATSMSKEDNVLTKRAKLDLGGLHMDYKAKLVGKLKPLLSAPVTSTKAQENLDSEPEGDFDTDESPAIMASACQAKTKGKTKATMNTDVNLVPANVSDIDVREHRNGAQRAPVKRQTITKANLPITSAADLRKWDAEYMLHIFDFVRAEEYQFGLSNNVELKYLIKSHWVAVFPLLKEQKDNPAIAPLVHLQIRTYRSKFGKKALKIIAQSFIERQLDTVEDHAEFVADQLRENRWAYGSPGTTRATSSKAMRGPFLLGLFTHHCEAAKTFKAKSPFGYPTGALALCATAVIQALNVFKLGANAIEVARRAEEDKRKHSGKGRASKNTKDSFGEEPWADYCGIYFKTVSKCGDAKWMLIFEGTEPYINVRKLNKHLVNAGDNTAVEEEDLGMTMSD
ncbi:hypothetical protein BDP27DRAFT_1433540 [Rhodocollybia butyracea]|uniref:Uncharacterized protein n=1 Tax=Rhodocollybia butyracea TaxID=206335 RepID=A0A9P5TY80_9AGAR|nr:hypothetical protein BDP27DRAFT_1433540 [Rhodocollybia butyracea]